MEIINTIAYVGGGEGAVFQFQNLCLSFKTHLEKYHYYHLGELLEFVEYIILTDKGGGGGGGHKRFTLLKRECIIFI